MADFTREDIKRDMQEIANKTVDQIVEVIHDLMRIMNDKFVGVDGRLDGIDLRLDGMGEQLVEIQEQNNQTQDIIKGVHNRLDDHGGRIVGVEKKVRRIASS